MIQKRKLTSYMIMCIMFCFIANGYSSLNFLTKNYADTLYCSINKDCTLATLTVNNLSVIGEYFNVSVTTVYYNVTGIINMDGNFTVDSPTFHVDSSGDKVGIGTTTPGEKLEVNGGGIFSDNMSAGNIISQNNMTIESISRTAGSGSVTDGLVLEGPTDNLRVGLNGESKWQIESTGSTNAPIYLRPYTGKVTVTPLANYAQTYLRVAEYQAGATTPSSYAALEYNSGTPYLRAKSSGVDTWMYFDGTHFMPHTDRDEDLGSWFRYWNNTWTENVILNTNVRIDGKTDGIMHVDADVGIGTTIPSAKLEVEGSIKNNGDINSTGYANSLKYLAQYHYDGSVDIPDTNWHNFTWNITIDGETTSGFTLSGNDTFVSDIEGITRIQGCAHFKNNKGAQVNARVAIRTLIDDDEARCLQSSDTYTRADGAYLTQEFTGTTNLTVGTRINIQYKVEDVDIDLEGDSIFEKFTTNSVNFETMSILD